MSTDLRKYWFFSVAGVTHANRDGTSRQKYLQELQHRSVPFPLQVRREPANQHDSNAIAILDPLGRQLGYVPREIAAIIAARMDAGVEVKAVAKSVDGGAGGYRFGLRADLEILAVDLHRDTGASPRHQSTERHGVTEIERPRTVEARFTPDPALVTTPSSSSSSREVSTPSARPAADPSQWPNHIGGASIVLTWIMLYCFGERDPRYSYSGPEPGVIDMIWSGVFLYAVGHTVVRFGRWWFRAMDSIGRAVDKFGKWIS